MSYVIFEGKHLIGTEVLTQEYANAYKRSGLKVLTLEQYRKEKAHAKNK